MRSKIGIHSMSCQEAIEQLLDYAKKVEGVAKSVASTRWSEQIEALTRLSEWREPEPITTEGLHQVQDYVASLRAAASLILSNRWVEALQTRMTDTYIHNLRVSRAAVCEKVEAASTGLLSGVTERAVKILEPQSLIDVADTWATAATFNPLILRVLIAQLQTAGVGNPRLVEETIAIVLSPSTFEHAASPEPGERADVHPLLKMGLTYGVSPLGYYSEEENRRARCSFAAEVPGGRPVLYDLATLLEGVSGQSGTGLNYTLVSSLETIRAIETTPGGRAELRQNSVAAGRQLQCRRKDHQKNIEGVEMALVRPLQGPLRPVGETAGVQHLPPDLEKMLRGPRPTLGAYNSLAEDAMRNAQGALLNNPMALIRDFEADGGGALESAAVRETEILQRLLAENSPGAGGEDSAPANVMRGASLIASERYSRESIRAMGPLPGADESQNEEAAMVALLGARRVGAALQKVAKKSDAAAGQLALKTAIPAILRSEEGISSSLKMWVGEKGRPGSGNPL